MCVINVITPAIPVTGITLKSSTTILMGSTEKLIPTISPSNASNTAITWSSSNTAVATVDSNGVVTGKAIGTANIVVTTNDGGKTSTCAVSVTSVPVVSIAFAQQSPIVLQRGTSVQTSIIFTPSNATNQTISSYYCDNTAIATITNNGLVKAGMFTGTCSIYAYSNDGLKCAVMTVQVTS